MLGPHTIKIPLDKQAKDKVNLFNMHLTAFVTARVSVQSPYLGWSTDSGKMPVALEEKCLEKCHRHLKKLDVQRDVTLKTGITG